MKFLKQLSGVVSMLIELAVKLAFLTLIIGVTILFIVGLTLGLRYGI